MWSEIIISIMRNPNSAEITSNSHNLPKETQLKNCTIIFTRITPFPVNRIHEYGVHLEPTQKVIQSVNTSRQ